MFQSVASKSRNTAAGPTYWRLNPHSNTAASSRSLPTLPKTASRLRFEPFCAWVQHANHSATEPPINILVISNHNSFRVLFDKIASVTLSENYIKTFLALEKASPWNRHCANCIAGITIVSTSWRGLNAATHDEGMVCCRSKRPPNKIASRQNGPWKVKTAPSLFTNNTSHRLPTQYAAVSYTHLTLPTKRIV